MNGVDVKDVSQERVADLVRQCEDHIELTVINNLSSSQSGNTKIPRRKSSRKAKQQQPDQAKVNPTHSPRDSLSSNATIAHDCEAVYYGCIELTHTSPTADWTTASVRTPIELLLDLAAKTPGNLRACTVRVSSLAVVILDRADVPIEMFDIADLLYFAPTFVNILKCSPYQ